jgi:hypothetical protein
MKTRTVVVGAVLVAAALAVAFTQRTGNDETPAGTPVQSVSRTEPAKASLPPPRHAEPAKPAAPSVAVAGAPRSPEDQRYESAPNLKVLADALEPRAAAGDKEAARVLAKALNECAPMSAFPDSVEKALRNLGIYTPDQRGAAEHHLVMFGQRCTDLVRAGKIDSARINRARRQSGGDDLVALAESIAEDPAGMPAPERADALRRILASRNGEAIFMLADAMLYVDDEGHGVLQRFSGDTRFLYAWKLVGCDLGASCGPDSFFVRYACTTLGQCRPGGYREHIRYFLVSPYLYENASDAEREILQAMADGQIESFF